MQVEADGADGVVGSFRARPAMWGTASNRLRIALLATAFDNAAGQIPSPPRFPTVDLRAQLVAAPPADGPVEVVGRPLRIGRKLIVSEFEARSPDGAVFGRGTATMTNDHHPFEQPADWTPTTWIPSFDRLLETRVVDACTLELDPSPRIANGMLRTPHGGAQMLFCELASEHLAGGYRAAEHIDIHFLSRGEVGPLRAIATRTGMAGGLDLFRVHLVDHGANDALFAAATIMSRPLERSELAQPLRNDSLG